MKSKLIKKEKIDYKWVSFDNLIKDLSKNKDFKKGYHEELAKLKIAQQIREARKEKKITQLVVAKRAGMPQSVVARIESGNHGTSLDTLAKVAHALGKEVKIV